MNYQTVCSRQTILLCLASFLLCGCSVLQPVKPVKMTTYAIDAQIEPASAEAGVTTLLVNTTRAQPGISSARMVYIQKQSEIAYFAENQWVGSPARMLTPLLVQALDSSSKYHAVVQMNSTVQADLRLDTEILHFQQEFLNQPGQVRVTVRAQLIDLHQQSVLASRVFDVTEATASEDPYGGVIAMNRAVKNLLKQIVEFCALGTQ